MKRSKKYYLLTWRNLENSINHLNGFYAFDEVSYNSLKNDIEKYDIKDASLTIILNELITNSKVITKEEFIFIINNLDIQMGRDVIKEFYDKIEEE